MVSSSSSTPKRYWRGTHRACDPAETLARISGYFPALGITRLADVTGLDSIGIPVCVAIRPNARSLSVSQGKGPTLESAKVSAVMESLETYHAENISQPLVEGSYREVIRHSAACDPLLLTLEPLSIYHENLPLKWIVGFDLLQQSNVLAPYDLVHCNYLAEPLKRPIFLMSSNGLASGNHVIEALSHAICEVVERDAGYLWELQTLDVTADSRLLDLSTVDSEVCRDLLEKFDAANISVSVWDQTSDVGLPVLGCALIEHHPARLMHRLGPYTGFGCHLSREIALARALTEAAQSRLTHIAGSRDDMYRSSYEGFRSEKYAAGLIQRVMDMQPGVDYHDLPTLETDSLEGDLSIQLDLVKRAGFNQVIWVDLTQSQIGIPVVRVIIPGMEFKVSHRGVPTRISQRTRERLLKMRLFAQLRGGYMMSDVYVFIGPTISSGEAKQYLNANYLPPVSQGDVSSLLRRKPKVIGIIDGYFECVPSVWHKEILLALSEGVHVVGGSSLGALRAAELHPFGMVGIGRIFQWYRDGTIEADDEVAIQHASEEFAFKALSDALVNIRATLQQAREQAVISPSTETTLLALGQMMHYTERSYPRILKAGLEAGLPPEEISALEQFIRAHAVDQKKRDAILVLQAIADLLERDEPHRAAFEMLYTARLDELLDRDISLDLCDGNRLTMETLVGHARQSRMDFAEVNGRAAVSHLLLKFAQQLGIRITQPEHLLGREEFCRRRGLNTSDRIDEWMRKNLLTAQEFDLLVEEYLLIQKVKMVCGPDNRDVIRQLRLEGAYAETVAAALKAHDDI